ncbi:hypothetical protein KPATCC21470_3241 [Kitasatospora purpeofusca]
MRPVAAVAAGRIVLIDHVPCGWSGGPDRRATAGWGLSGGSCDCPTIRSLLWSWGGEI